MPTRREYGPHHPEDAPPLPPLLMRQRVQINGLAAGLRRGPCQVCGRDEWDCLAVRPGPDAHAYEPRRRR